MSEVEEREQASRLLGYKAVSWLAFMAWTCGALLVLPQKLRLFSGDQFGTALIVVLAVLGAFASLTLLFEAGRRMNLNRYNCDLPYLLWVLLQPIPALYCYETRMVHLDVDARSDEPSALSEWQIHFPMLLAHLKGGCGVLGDQFWLITQFQDTCIETAFEFEEGTIRILE